MAIDGSFSMESELKRFLDRCPKLKLNPFIYNLLNKSEKVKEEEVVEALAELVLLPNYTIPLLGCFRPIAQNIVDRTVGLLRLVPSLRSDDVGSATEKSDDNGLLREDDGVNYPSVIDNYSKKGKGLYLHELACLAFCQALDLIPLLLKSILDYFKFAPAPFERILVYGSISGALSKDPNQLLNVVRASYRFLLLETDAFKALWNWSCFLDLVQIPSEFDSLSDDALRNILSDLRWCGIGVLSLVLRLKFETCGNLGLSSKEAFLSFLRWQEFCMDVSLEKGGFNIESSANQTNELVGRNSLLNGGSFLCQCQLSTFLKQPSVDMANTVLPTEDAETLFVVTSSLTKSFEMISLAVSQRWPVVLYGPPSSGKTSLINKFAHSLGSKVLSIYMDEQVDGKTLVGSYVCTEQPGEFQWQPGSLTQAVMNGYWVVFEDIDKSPADVFSILVPLLEGAIEFSTGHGEAVKVNDGFRLFATVTSLIPGTSPSMEGRLSLGASWMKVMIDSPNKADLFNIMQVRYPELEPVAGKLIESFETGNQLMGSRLGLTTPKFCGRFTLRDLLKLSRRVASMGFHFGQDGISSYACESIFKEAVDVFASFSTSEMNRLVIMKEMAKLWGVSVPETLYPANKPVIQEFNWMLQVGRVSLRHAENVFNSEKKPFVELRASLYALERIASSVKYNEPVLLVGETGTGKTTLVQTLASRLGQKLTVLNLSQQSDVADLLGGFKPIDARFVCIPLYQEFENLFTNSFSSKENEGFLSQLRKFVTDKNWKMLLNGFLKGARKIVEVGKVSPGNKRKRPLSDALKKAWEIFSTKLERARVQVSASDGMVFSFVEGAFITALRNGYWILLDEVNLAPPEILQRAIGVLDNEKGSLCLAERGDLDYISRHSNFRMFACMNPATDAGKRDLANSIRSRFTEYYVDDALDDDDLALFVKRFTGNDSSLRSVASNIVRFYKAAKQSEERLQDGANQRPHFSLRSLYRALEYLQKAKRQFGFERSLYDGFSMFFLNLLDDASSKSMNNMICKHLLGVVAAPQPLPFDSYLVNKAGLNIDDILTSYVLTKSVKEHLRNLARAVFVGRYPVLLQGPTSSGKTSLVKFLAAITGREFVRINNHEHTDLQEYLGSYTSDSSGKLIFQEGALIKAVRKGHWVVLDELNLAPSDVLEALNRLLDDNRELFVPEMRETIRCHPDFMLFATQNPPGFYGGRKLLSRAFRNRFMEIHVDDIPQEELTEILEKKCEIPGSCAEKMVNVMKELQLHRQSSKIFSGKHGYVTPRDLFRWANRFTNCGRDLAYDGYYLMAERLRDDAEKRVVKDILERCTRVTFSDEDLYKREGEVENFVVANNHVGHVENVGKIIWTRSLWRTYFLVERCHKMREPVLLVGETGGGKTTVCQLLSTILGSKLHILNCHQYTETSDFLGGFYPVRERSGISSDFHNLCNNLACSKAFIYCPWDSKISTDINQASQTLNLISLVIKSYKDGSVCHSEVTLEEICHIEKIHQNLCQLQKKWQTIFTWQDGPLIEAMKRGEMFLIDEISLADDSVLERLNSVLEPERKLSLAEKGGPHLETVDAHENFFLLATMNPGGDYGKKELSPALRNRFTEIWVPSVTDIGDLKSIALDRILNSDLAYIVDAMLDFWEWFNLLQIGRVLTVRDLLSWVSFINVTEESLSGESAFLHGAFLVLLDGLFLGTNVSKGEAAELRVQCFRFLLRKIKDYNPSFDTSTIERLESYGWGDDGSSPLTCITENMKRDALFGIDPFYIEKGTDDTTLEEFEFLAPTTHRNSLRVLRALQLKKPVLLEGSPGVGKTSLIIALGKFSGHTVVRINLSEQTDIMDLLGCDLPVESDEGIQFAWSDGILLQALKKGSWVLLDELNLAPQSVLEGLNAILDHRAEVFIPELGQSFKCPASFRVFACQNPSYEGGGRKGLPKSFLNRFTKVYVDELIDEDYLSICSSRFPSIESSLLSNLITFNKRLHQETMLFHKFGQDGSPWEFNLRDVIRSCEIIQSASKRSKSACFLNPIYLQRMRTPADRKEVMKLYEQTFGVKPFVNAHPKVMLDSNSLRIGTVSIERNSCQLSMSSGKLMILPSIRNTLEAVAHCVRHQWLCILVGPASSGKTSLIRLLSELTGNNLNELNLSSATDISELLGCFEQYNASHHYRLAISQVESYMNEYCNLISSSADVLFGKKVVIAQWLAFLSDLDRSVTFVDHSTMKDAIQQLIFILESLRADACQQAWPFSRPLKDLDNTLSAIKKLGNDCQKQLNSVKFEWVTGSLVKAIQNGEWIVLENANLCNPTVLDRINSLVEQSGSITINEAGIVEGNPVVLHPHPRFRMFLTVNPSFGEVSRAMRNRGVEIFMMDPNWMGETSCPNSYEIELNETKRFITLSGITVNKLVDMMAKTHVYAKHEGVHLNVSITYLQLSRWLELFQRLVTNGNQPAWSILKSWEHTYLSSFGEEKARNIFSRASLSFLPISELYRYTSPEDSLLCLPGGWPAPLKIKDYVLHPKEACVRQNLMYLQSLGSQIAALMHRVTLKKGFEENYPANGGTRMLHIFDAVLLRRVVFPDSSDDLSTKNYSQSDMELALKKLTFAADWAIEQASEGDYWLYICWFEWFGNQLQPFVSFFSLYSDLLKRELQHSIWKRIFQLRNEIISEDATGKGLSFMPLLSIEQIDMCQSVGWSDSYKILLNGIKCVTLLRRSLQQWSREDQHYHPAMVSLRRLEEKVLDILVDSPSFDELFMVYSDLLEYHTIFWNSFISLQSEPQLIYGKYLLKAAMKFKGFCSEETVLHFQVEMEKVGFSLTSSLSKSLLWAYGGRPIMPSSAGQYQMQCKISTLCEKLRPRKCILLKQDKFELNEAILYGALSAVVELRVLAMEGLGLSSCIIDKVDNCEAEIVQQLEGIHQRLLERFDSEKQKLVLELDHSPSPKLLPGCCIFTPGLLCRRYGFTSWLKIQPLLDETSVALDLELLQPLTRVSLVDSEKLHDDLLKLSSSLKSSLDFSLKYSSRSPADLLPHQKILWTLGACKSVTGAHGKVSSFILQLWLRWHATLWEVCPMVSETQAEDNDIVLPYKFFRPLKLATVDHFLQNVDSIGDHCLHSFNLRAACHNLWKCSPSLTSNVTNFYSVLLSIARSLFQQIVCAHKKSFKDSTYTKIISTFHSLMDQRNADNIAALIDLLKLSNHCEFTTLIDIYIEPLLREIYSVTSSNDILSVGYALFYIGGLRYNLLVCPGTLDPCLKHSIKYSVLTEKMASLESEIEVRKECVYLAGTAYGGDGDSCRKTLLEELSAEREKMQRKMVYRPNAGKLKELEYLWGFRNSVKDMVEQTKSISSFKTEVVAGQMNSWQRSLSCVNDLLSSEFSAFGDITEPIQVALYEMKLGLSLMLSGDIYDGCVENSKHDKGSIMTLSYTLMRFPRVCSSTPVSVNFWGQPILSTQDIKLPSNVEDLDGLQSTLCFIKDSQPTKDTLANSLALPLSFRISFYHHILQRIRDSAAVSHFLGDTSFKLLHEVFDKVARLWMENRMKNSAVAGADEFKFRARAFKMASIIEIDLSNCSNMLPVDSFSEWQDLLSEELDEKISVEDGAGLEHDWDVNASFLNGVVNIHNQLFGSVDLIQRPGRVEVSDMDVMSSFVTSYLLGLEMTKDMKGPATYCFDAKLAPEHLLRLSLEQDNKLFLSNKLSTVNNFYKDPNADVIIKLVDPVMQLKQEILALLEKYDNHPALQRILEVTDMILALPLDSPLAKGLSALEFLLNRVLRLQDTIIKFSASEQLQSILSLVASWHKLEFESWPALLDEVDAQLERSVGKLWFPLYSIFLRGHTTDLDNYCNRTIESLEEFFNTSSIGEFKRQLQLLLSFHGQNCRDSSQSSQISTCQEENIKILYNTFGLYLQLLPRILHHIGNNRRSIEKELNELLKLCRWDRIEKHLTIETFKKTRLKMRKIVKKYSDLLQQPVVAFLAQEASRTATAQFVQGQNLFVDSYDASTFLRAITNQIELTDKECSTWFSDWWKNLASMEEAISGITDVLPPPSSCLTYWEERKQASRALEDLCSSLIHCEEIWEDKSTNLRKRRAFSDLLKMLEAFGLSKNRPTMEGQFSRSKNWIRQPAYEVQHLLMQSENLSENDLSHLQKTSQDHLWKASNKYYFKSITAIMFLEKVSLNFHKDLSNMQVTRARSFVDHLIEIQQEQRAVTYDFSKKLKFLRQCMWPLTNLFSLVESNAGCFPKKSQLSILKCLWHQKQIFDGLCSLLHEEEWLLQTVGGSHLSSCSTIKVEAENLCRFIQKVLPDLQKFKKTLDKHLLGSSEDDYLVGVALLHPYGITQEMEELAHQNFKLIKTLEKNISAFQRQGDVNVGAGSILLRHLEDILVQARTAAELYYSPQQIGLSNIGVPCDEESLGEYKICFNNALEQTFQHILSALQNLGHRNYDFADGEEALRDIRKWKFLFEKDIEHLQLDVISADVSRTVQCLGELLSSYGEENFSLNAITYCQLRNLYLLLEKILAFGDNLLLDFLKIHSVVCEVTYGLANAFSSLFTKGFGGNEDVESTKEEMADGCGTGMGEGTGVTDVSDQINDEDQLLGSSGKPNEESESPSDMPNKNEKGIEMEQDFDAEAFSVSEDSETDENDDTEGEEPESAMGEVGDNSNVVDEKVNQKGDDDEDDDTNENYESGLSVKDKGSRDDQLRGKEESAGTVEASENHDPCESAEHNEEEKEDGHNDRAEDMTMDKDEAFADPSGINPEDQNQSFDQTIPMDEEHFDEPTEDGESEDLNDTEMNDSEEKIDEFSEDVGTEQLAEDMEVAELDQPTSNDDEITKEYGGGSNFFQKSNHNLEQPASNDGTGQLGGQSTEDHPDATEDHSTVDRRQQCDLAPTTGMPNASEFEVSISDSRNGKRLSNERSSSSLSPLESPSQNLEPNPYRNIGSAIEGWKERVKVSVDLQKEEDMAEDCMNDNADEYGYTAEFQEGTAQALGPAMADQIKGVIPQNDVDNDNGTTIPKDAEDKDRIEKSESETLTSKSAALNHGLDAKNQQTNVNQEMQDAESMEVNGDHDQNESVSSDSLITVRRSYMSEEMNQYGKSESNDDHLGNAHKFEPSADLRDDAAALWRKFELHTTRLSHELVEQLRLVMEPTTASKLQGDYRTGKKINMKKVIPYIASHYRKDKIWQRRTRPSKRDYQVVIAVDDSRSMSEGNCDSFALEALVTVCRGMSQLEVGNLAVASFGKQGNIRLLHDFDQPFTPEAGIKMISSLSFKQENTIVDEPMADLLKYLDNMLDSAVMRSRLPSGRNPLQQLVLIIADGRFNEKEKLKRYVRDILSKQRMVAFLVLDSPNESIIDLMEARVEEKKAVKLCRYMDTFPFPYYVVLKKIESLPRTVADLLRQWFELMHNSRE